MYRIHILYIDKCCKEQNEKQKMQNANAILVGVLFQWLIFAEANENAAEHENESEPIPFKSENTRRMLATAATAICTSHTQIHRKNHVLLFAFWIGGYKMVLNDNISFLIAAHTYIPINGNTYTKCCICMCVCFFYKLIKHSNMRELTAKRANVERSGNYPFVYSSRRKGFKTRELK